MRILICFLAFSLAAFAQEAPKPNTDNPVTSFNKTAFNHVKGWILSSADKMPEENFNFKPADTVRSFGQILGHIADSQQMFCSGVLGEQVAPKNIEKTKTSKADLVAALNESFIYCDKAYSGMTDTSGAQLTKFHGRDRAKFNVLTANVMHMVEHYGNLVTYLRIKNIVPPSSETPPAPPEKK
jgi:uncharacterized damage-inducible protein DinB